MINRNFTLLLTGQLVSQVGDKFHMIALSLWVLNTTGSSAKMGAVLAASLIPSLILGLFSGAIIDRYNKKYIIVGADLIRGIIISGFAILFYFEAMNFYLVLIMQIALGLNAAFFDPAIPSMIPRIVNTCQLNRANSIHQFVSSLSMIGGAFLGGIGVSVFGYFWVFVLNAVSFLISAGFESVIRIKEPNLQNLKNPARSLLRDIKKGYSYIFSKSDLIILLLMVMVIHFFVGSLEILMPIIAHTVSGDPARYLGFFQAAFGFGTLIMSLFLSTDIFKTDEKKTLFAGVFIMGGLYAISSFFNPSLDFAPLLFIIVIFLFGSAVICAAISFRTLIQRGVDPSFSGRVFAVAGSFGNASIPGAMVVYGLILEIEKVVFQDLLLISGLVLMSLSVISFFIFKEDFHDCKKETQIRPVPQR